MYEQDTEEAELEFSRWISDCIKNIRREYKLSWNLIAMHLTLQASLCNLRVLLRQEE